MKKLLALSLVSSSLLLSTNKTIADDIYFWEFGTDESLSDIQTKTIWKLNTSTQQTTKALTYESGNKGNSGKGTFLDPYEQKIYQIGTCLADRTKNCFDIYDLKTNTVTQDTTQMEGAGTAIRVPEGITKDANGVVTVGGDANEIHIGENSWITKEENGRQKVYAKDAAGNPIPIDYTNGTKLLINGRDVEQSINNVGALSAALTGLPTVPTDTTLACGLGTGTHGGDFAFSGGCASKINEKLSINYAASMTMPGQDYIGDFEDQFSARAGFVWKLGKSVKPNLMSMKEKKEFKKEISVLRENNKNILSKNQKLENKIFTLMARLERLEKIALSETTSKDVAVYKLK